jgi:hypothetical protein
MPGPWLKELLRGVGAGVAALQLAQLVALLQSLRLLRAGLPVQFCQAALRRSYALMEVGRAGAGELRALEALHAHRVRPPDRWVAQARAALRHGEGGGGGGRPRSPWPQ